MLIERGQPGESVAQEAPRHGLNAKPVAQVQGISSGESMTCRCGAT
ncbi:hypothetical protein [Bradyrhizobium sp. WSM471]|nr:MULTISPECIES: hypothetical protein [Bradyrhizobium]UFW43144.1 hypothetical protein BcanWSM471_08625 [Bradyrhizobium canariense]